MKTLLLGFTILNIVSAFPGYARYSAPNRSQDSYYFDQGNQNYQGYTQQPSNYQNQGYSQQPAYNQNQGYAQQPAYNQNPGYNQAPAYHQNPGYQNPSYVNQNDGYYPQAIQHNPNANQNGRVISTDSFATASDRELLQKVRDALTGGWFSKGIENLSLNINNGTVTITGIVDAPKDFETIREKVRKIDGVRVVNIQLASRNPDLEHSAYDSSSTSNDDDNTLTTNPNDRFGSEADRLLVNKIRNELSGWFTNKYKNASISAFNGIVTIEGTVDSTDDQQKATKDIQKIEGVRSVNNQLVVKSSSSSSKY